MMSRSKKNDPIDFFPTPPEPTQALMLWAQEYNIRFSDTIWEPACGDGAISEVIETFEKSINWPGSGNYETFNTDLKEYGYKKQDNQFDFLKQTVGGRYSHRFDIITNPPYSRHLEFIEKALALCRRYVVMLLPLTYMTPANKRDLYNEYAKVTFLPLGFRPAFIMPGRTKASKMKDYMWVVWDRHELKSLRHDMYILEHPNRA